MRLSIITPSIARSSLVKLCQTIDEQTDQDYEHIIMVDVPIKELADEQKICLAQFYGKSNRKLLYCEKRHYQCGNTCRHNACDIAKGDYIFYIDDDDYFADNDVFKTLREVDKDWAIFPMLLNGRVLFTNPPQGCQISTGNFMHRRGFVTWPDTSVYESDWMIVEQMLQKAPYQVLNTRPLVIHPQHNVGRYF
jgi:glycosyltransferase involved in cell wall biosynthesis